MDTKTHIFDVAHFSKRFDPIPYIETASMSSEPTVEEEQQPHDDMLVEEDEATAKDEQENVSALRENIRRKGKNAYYFAHDKTPQGPAWDGKPEPKRLLEERHRVALERKYSSFDIHKSTITKYAFCDGEKSVKLYIDVDDTVTPERVSLEFTEESLSLVLEQASGQEDGLEEQQQAPKTLYFTKLAGKITKATFKVKAEDKLLVLNLKKQVPGETWHTINARASPDHDVV